MQSIKDFYSAEYFENEGRKALEILNDYLERILKNRPELKALPVNDPERLYEKYFSLLNEKISSHEFLDELIRDSNHLHHRGYTGHQCAVPNPLAAISSMAGSLLNNGSAVYEMGPANVAMERVVARLFADAFSFPEDAEGLFTSGGSLGNLTALLAARQNQTGYDIWEEGVRTGDQPAFMISEASHYCVPRAVKIMGLGQKAIVSIPVDSNYRMRTDLLESAYQKAKDEGKRIVALTANACSTATGSYDNLSDAADFCRKHNIWFHIDGAHGGAAILSKKYKNLLQGAEMADSIVIDFHKMLMTPGLNTLILFRNGKTSWSTFAQRASYLLDEESKNDWFNYAKRTMECTKSMMGLNVYIQLLTGGRELFEENIDRLYDMGKAFASLCMNKPGIELAIEPDANIVCFRFNDKGENLNMINQKIREQLLSDGDFYIVQTFLGKDQYLRVSIMNPVTGEKDLEDLLETVVLHGTRLRNNSYFT